MGEREAPMISDNPRGEEYTCVTFYPDLRKFNMTELDEDIVSLMTKRVYDLAGVTPGHVKVKLNGRNIECKDFNTYVDLYLQAEEHKTLPKLIEKA
jgi:DNA topoisomerase-2